MFNISNSTIIKKSIILASLIGNQNIKIGYDDT